jgi:hypothetical protein
MKKSIPTMLSLTSLLISIISLAMCLTAISKTNDNQADKVALNELLITREREIAKAIAASVNSSRKELGLEPIKSENIAEVLSAILKPIAGDIK